MSISFQECILGADGKNTKGDWFRDSVGSCCRRFILVPCCLREFFLLSCSSMNISLSSTWLINGVEDIFLSLLWLSRCHGFFLGLTVLELIVWKLQRSRTLANPAGPPQERERGNFRWWDLASEGLTECCTTLENIVMLLSLDWECTTTRKESRSFSVPERSAGSAREKHFAGHLKGTYLDSTSHAGVSRLLGSILYQVQRSNKMQ
jgi:hypothetical protein